MLKHLLSAAGLVIFSTLASGCAVDVDPDGDGDENDEAVVIEDVPGSETQGVICGHFVCCSTAPNGACWPMDMP